MIKRGSLNLRHELKYMINYMEYRLLKSRLKEVLNLDPHCGLDGLYHVRSLYFDDCRNGALSDKLAGVYCRKKYRLRIYNHNQECIKLEKKSKIDNLIGKESVSLNRRDVDRILQGDIDFLAESQHKVLRAFYLECKRNLLKPNVITDYYREVYVYPVGNVRISFDIGLHTGLNATDLFNKESFMMGISDYPVILEVKYDSVLPQVIHGLISCIISPQSSISKFVNCKRFSTFNSWEDQ